MIRKVESYELLCDECFEQATRAGRPRPDLDARFEDGNDWSIFADPGYARDSARESDWEVPYTEDGRILDTIPGRDLCHRHNTTYHNLHPF
jgi:hypothetical protein